MSQTTRAPKLPPAPSVSISNYKLPHYPFVVPDELRTGAVKHHPIVIVGAGLSGLTLACKLAHLGIAAVVLG
jgi:3-(3-hydroxy-phenyl)propionate hydroxylase